MKGNEVTQKDITRWNKEGYFPVTCRICGEVMLYPKKHISQKTLLDGNVVGRYPQNAKGRGDGMSVYEFDLEFEELMDKALNELSPRDFKTFLDHIDQIIANYQDEVTE